MVINEKPSADALRNEEAKNVANHRKTAAHLEIAARHHLEAAKHHEDGQLEKASQATLKALGHTAIANDIQRTDAKYHALNPKD
ncbi:MAG: hypothetical protein QM534_10270 [Sediminibacterium sp.]|nr:hypothetical protein [Sediminibacterium sp.]